MKKLITVLALAFPLVGLAAGPSIDLDDANVNLDNKKALQRGAQLYMNYCMGCHSLKFQRYNRMAQDLGLTDKEVLENLVFTTDKYGERTKVGSLATNTMDFEYAEVSFGAAPPDLSLVARSRGPDWLYTYLRSFYHDPARPLGANNTVFPNVGMPHVLWELQGWKEPVYEEYQDSEGTLKERITGFKTLTEGSMTDEEYDGAMRDLVSFLEYVGEPAKLVRGRVGVGVLLFLFVFTVIAYLLKREYWRDIH